MRGEVFDTPVVGVSKKVPTALGGEGLWVF